MKTLEARESTIQSEIKKAVASGNPFDLVGMWSKLDRQSSVSEDDKRQFQILVDKLDDLEKKLGLVLAKNDTVSISAISVEMRKTREKIERLKNWGNVP